MAIGDVPPNANAFLVCGLGSLGQSCVSALKSFGASVYAIDLAEERQRSGSTLLNLLDGFWVGDCRQVQVLEAANIRNCRSVLLVTSNDRVNLAAAFAARAVNPNIRLVVRSHQENLNALLKDHLGNFVAFEPTQLTASAIALAGLHDETLGFFQLSGHLLRVTQQRLSLNHPWCNCRYLYELNSSSRRVLHYAQAEEPYADRFYQWEPKTQVQVGDHLIYLEIADKLAVGAEELRPQQPAKRIKRTLRSSAPLLQQQLKDIWRSRSQTERVALIGILILLMLFSLGIVLYRLQYPELSFQDALNVSLVLILGGYDNVFGQLKLPFPTPAWLHAFSLGLTLAGTLFIGILYAMLTERVFSARMAFLRARPPIPTNNHVVLVGLDQVGQQVASLLQDLKHPCVGISLEGLDAATLPQLPLAVGKVRDALLKVNLATARSAMVLTNDEIANLEIGLMIQAIRPRCPLVLRTSDSQFGEHIIQLLPNAKAFSVDALAAEVFAAAAFGENILSLLHLHRLTALVTEYRVEADDTLQGRLLAEVAYGFEVVPILHQRTPQELEKLMPSDDIRLRVGDRLVILATLEGLQNIEGGTLQPPTWLVQIEKVLSPNASFEGITTLARISGCELGMARTLMEHLPGTLSFPLYKPQAQRLVRELSKVQVLAQVIPVRQP